MSGIKKEDKDMNKLSEIISNKGLLVIRSITLTLNIIITIYAGYRSHSDFGRYFTKWGLMLSIITLFFLLLATCCSSPQLNYISLILYETSWTVSAGITLIYWSILLPISGGYDESDPILKIVSRICTHSVPLISMIIDAVFNNYRFTFGHIWFPIGFLILYLIFDVVLTFTTGHNAYSLLNYQNYYSLLVIFGFMAIFLAFFLLAYYIHKIKYVPYPPMQPYILSHCIYIYIYIYII